MTPREYGDDNPALGLVKAAMKEVLEDLHDAKILNDTPLIHELESALTRLREQKKILLNNISHIKQTNDRT